MEPESSPAQQVQNGLPCKAATKSGGKIRGPLKSEQRKPIAKRMSLRIAAIAAKQRKETVKSVRRGVKLLNDKSERKKNKSVSRTKSAENEAVEELEQKAPNASLDSNGGQMINVGLDGLKKIAERSACYKVKKTLRQFNKYYLQSIQEEDNRCNKVAEQTKRTAKRPDLRAITKMLQTEEILYHRKRIGDLPGISVGHQFYSRAEMVALGFHGHWLNGIDYMGPDYKKDYPSRTLPLATSVVLAGMYEDDLDNAEEVVYTGHGGHRITGDRKNIGDQKMERGNLALKNCMKQDLPVRVVRGHRFESSYCGKIYTYDGLYKINRYWAEKGLSGYKVYKFELRRLEGQPPLTTNQVYFAYGGIPKSPGEIRGMVCADISGGQEKIPIPATNLVDDPPVAPTGFIYTKYMMMAENVTTPPNANGCSCKGKCFEVQSCACAQLNGSNFPYVQIHGGRLVKAKDIVYECGPNCGCGPECVNRTSQKGLKYHFEVFRTPKKGWGIRSWNLIPAGAMLFEYIGVLRKAKDAESATNNDYLFDIDCLQTIKGLGGRKKRSKDRRTRKVIKHVLHDSISESEPEYCIDASTYGNIARFVNHSCDPNLFVQCILSSHWDLKLARIMFFAADNIPPLQELTIDYGYVLDSVCGPDGKIRKEPCFCGAVGCRKRLF